MKVNLTLDATRNNRPDPYLTLVWPRLTVAFYPLDWGFTWDKTWPAYWVLNAGPIYIRRNKYK